MPSLGLDEEGGFSVLYDMRQVGERDHYGKNPYAAYMYADQPLETIENLDAAGGPHGLSDAPYPWGTVPALLYSDWRPRSL